MRVPFIKMHGLGNDFVVLDGRAQALPAIDTRLAAALADRHRGIGCDQLVVLDNVCGQILGRSFCALGDAAATPFPSAMKYFADEFEAGTTTPSSVAFDPAASTVFSEVKA